MVMQYFTHFAQQLLLDSRIAFLGHISMHLLHFLQSLGSIAGNFVDLPVELVFIFTPIYQKYPDSRYKATVF